MLQNRLIVEVEGELIIKSETEIGALKITKEGIIKKYKKKFYLS